MPVPWEDSDTSPQQVYLRGGTTLAGWGARPGEDVRELRRAPGRGVSLNIKVSAGAWERAGARERAGAPPPSPQSSLPCPPARGRSLGSLRSRAGGRGRGTCCRLGEDPVLSGCAPETPEDAQPEKSWILKCLKKCSCGVISKILFSR